MNIRAALSVTVVVLGISGTGCFAQELEFPTDRDNLFHVVAVNLNAPELCGRINPRADGGGGAWAPAGHQVTSLQSSCYRILADAMKDPSLCDKVVAVRTFTLDGRKMDKSDCLAGGGSGAIVTPHPNEMESFVALLQRLGYGDPEVLDSEYQENPQNSSTFAALAKLLDDPEFLQRLRSAPSYAEPRSDTDMRPAHPIEFLYQLVAVERNDADLCARVSPNATFVTYSERRAFLHAACYSHIAVNTLQADLCDPLPRAASSPFIERTVYPYEWCMETVAIGRQRTVKSTLRSGPYPFPHAADFLVSLQAIGYPPAYTSTLVPKPPSSSYWDFVSRLRFRGTAADRAEFVRRVNELP